MNLTQQPKQYESEEDQVTGNYTFAGGGLVHEHAESQFTDTTEIEDAYWVLAPGGDIVTNYSTGNGPVFDGFGSSGPFPLPLEAGALSLQNPDAAIYYPASASEGGNTKVGYFVGGAGQLNQQVLLAANATVQEGLVQKYNGYNVFGSGTTFTNAEVVDGDLGQQGSHGWVHHLEETGGLVDITPTTDTPPFLSLSWPNVEPYALAITVNNSVTLSNDVVVPGADFCVGEGLTFDVVGLSPYRYQHDDVAKWTLPGTFVNTNPYPNCSAFYNENTALLTRHHWIDGAISTTPCWYVLDGRQMTVSVVVYYACYDTGETFTQRVAGLFNVHRPTTALASPYQPDGAPTVLVVGQILTLGNGTNDMSFQHTITTDAYCAGQAGYVQVVDGDYTDPKNETCVPVPINGPALDGALGEFPADRRTSVPANASNSLLNRFYDGPYVVTWNGCASEELNFQTYLMFQPPGGIWVPLRKITWNLKDESMNWTVQAGSSASQPDDSPTTDFPKWIKKF